MEEKKFTVRIKGPNSKDRIVQDWMVEANNRMRLAGQLAYARDEGIKQGIKKGLKQGIKQGIKKGTKEGAEEKELEVIKAMLKKNMGYNTISEVTNKSIEEIKKIEATM